MPDLFAKPRVSKPAVKTKAVEPEPAKRSTKALPPPVKEKPVSTVTYSVSAADEDETEDELRLAIRTQFGSHASPILDKLDQNDNDGASSLVYKSLLRTMVGVLPIAEKNVRKTKGARGVYQFNQLVSQLRELLVDIQTMQDKGQMGQRVVERCVRPALLDIGGQLTLAFSAIELLLQRKLEGEDLRKGLNELDQLKQNIAQYFVSRYEVALSDVAKALS